MFRHYQRLANREAKNLNMQLLFEEFLKKVYGVSKGNTNSLMLIIVIRFMVYGFILGALALVIYLI